MNKKEVIVIHDSPIKNNAGLRGKDIGFVWRNTPPVELEVDYDSEMDGWVKVTNPNPWVGKQNPNKEQGWIEKAHVSEQTDEVEQYIITGKNISIRKIG